MSFQIRNIREVSNDPLTKFVNQLSKKLAVFLNKQETDKLENKEDIYSDGQDVDVVLRFQSLTGAHKFDFLTQYFPPTEPDYNLMKLWLRGDNLGNTIPDNSGFENHGTLNGDPMLLDGTPFDYGIHHYGMKSICNRFNRPTSDFENHEYISVPDNASIQITGIVTGISFFFRFRIHSLAQQGSLNRTLFSKIDDSTPNNGYQLNVGTDGSLKFSIKIGGNNYDAQAAAGTIAINTVYEVWCTYAVSGNVLHIYVNNVDKSLTDPGTPTWHSTLTNHDLSVFRRGQGTSGGYAYADLYDAWIMKEKVVSSTEVGYHYTNKWTLANLQFGQVAIANYFATYWESPSSTSFTSTSFSSASFTTA